MHDPLREAARREPAARAVLADALEARGELEAAAALRAFREPRTLGDLDLRGDYSDAHAELVPSLLVVANLAGEVPVPAFKPHLTIRAQPDDLGATISWVRGRRVLGRGPPVAEALAGLSDASRAEWAAVRWLIEGTPRLVVDLVPFTLAELHADTRARTLRDRLLSYLSHHPYFGVLLPFELGSDDDRGVFEALLDLAAHLEVPVLVGTSLPPPLWTRDATLRSHPGARNLVLIGGQVTPTSDEPEATSVPAAYAVAASVGVSWLTAGGGLAALPAVPATFAPWRVEESVLWRSRGITSLEATATGCQPFAPVIFAEGDPSATSRSLPCVLAFGRVRLDLHRARRDLWGRALARGTAEELATMLELSLKRRHAASGASIALARARFVEEPGLARGSISDEPVDVFVSVTGSSGETVAEPIRSVVRRR